MAAQDDIAAAREAVRSLERAVHALGAHYRDTVDRRRLQADVGRLTEDLDLLCGAQAQVPERPVVVVPDSPYAHDFWMDAEDEGLGRADYGNT